MLIKSCLFTLNLTEKFQVNISIIELEVNSNTFTLKIKKYKKTRSYADENNNPEYRKLIIYSFIYLFHILAFCSGKPYSDLVCLLFKILPTNKDSSNITI